MVAVGARRGGGGGGVVGRDGRVPQQVAYQVVLADVAAEEVDARAAGGVGGCEARVVRRLGVGVEVGLAEHVGLADHAGRYADGVDRAVELGVGGCHEHLIQAAAALAPCLI